MLMKTLTDKVCFTNEKGIDCTFNTETNTLNNSQMFWIDPYVGMYHSNKREVKRMIKSIREKYNCG